MSCGAATLYLSNNLIFAVILIENAHAHVGINLILGVNNCDDHAITTESEKLLQIFVSREQQHSHMYICNYSFK